jgi:hypothetical protein
MKIEFLLSKQELTAHCRFSESRVQLASEYAAAVCKAQFNVCGLVCSDGTASTYFIIAGLQVICLAYGKTIRRMYA